MPATILFKHVLSKAKHCPFPQQKWHTRGVKDSSFHS